MRHCEKRPLENAAKQLRGEGKWKTGMPSSIHGLVAPWVALEWEWHPFSLPLEVAGMLLEFEKGLEAEFPRRAPDLLGVSCNVPAMTFCLRDLFQSPLSLIMQLSFWWLEDEGLRWGALTLSAVPQSGDAITGKGIVLAQQSHPLSTTLWKACAYPRVLI